MSAVAPPTVHKPSTVDEFRCGQSTSVTPEKRHLMVDNIVVLPGQTLALRRDFSSVRTRTVHTVHTVHTHGGARGERGTDQYRHQSGAVLQGRDQLMSIRTPFEQSVHDPVDIANPKLDSLSTCIHDGDAVLSQVKCGECPHVHECPHARTLCPSTTTSLEVDTDSRTRTSVHFWDESGVRS